MHNTLQSIQSGQNKNFFLIAGPCVVESHEGCRDIAREVKTICEKLDIPYIFKASFRKANRSRIDAFSGIGDREALQIIQSVGKEFNLPTTTDIHQDSDAELAAQYVDVLQIPAFLCRQTSLLLAAAATQKVVSVKKGQFMSPEAMEHVVQKIRQSQNNQVWLIDRGTCFGYQDLIVDFRGIPTMQKFNLPVIMDCTHSLQQPNQPAGITGGRPDLIPTIAKAAIAVGADGLFIETHPNPSQALSDGANMLPLHHLDELLRTLTKIRSAINA